ncbi:MAG: AP endonuclease [Spirochaetaceae bacterium]|nr:MAG: AP endonuclease [Spirochaetaceae bacterium]
MVLSVPSYVIPGTYGENVVFLAGRSEIQAIEFLFYTFDAESRDLFTREKPLIASYWQRFSYAVHMPDRLLPEHELLIELTRDLCDRYILHPPPGDLDGFQRLLTDWQSRYGRVFLIENLIAGDFALAAELMAGFPLCCDTGHLLKNGSAVSGFLRRFGPRIEEIHLHGVVAGMDHRAFAARESWFQRILPFLKTFAGVLNLEVFSIEEVNELIAALGEAGVLPQRRN